MTGKRKRYLALVGGVGGAKLLVGLTQLLRAEELTCVVNTADDFTHLGLHISPDLDTVIYTLAGINNPDTGWGIAGETWHVMAGIDALDGPVWFQLGDRDIATHLVRTALLREGHSLTQATDSIASRLGVSVRILPMSDDRVSSIVQTTEGDLPFQEYFVMKQCRPEVTGFHFHGVETARPAPDMMELLERNQISGIILCPSNPFVSLDPILSLPGVRAALQACEAPVVAVSPLMGEQAFKGPTAKMMRELNLKPGPEAVVEHFSDLLSGFILDESDAAAEVMLSDQTLTTSRTAITMKTLEDRVRVAQSVLDLLEQLA